MFDVSIVIVTWKMRDMLRDLLLSIRERTHGVGFEIIIIDNSSRDGTVEMLKDKFPEVRLVQNLRNQGVAKARNQGLRLAGGRYILFLDADMVLIENTIFKLVEFADSHPEAGVTASRLTFPDGQIQPSCRRYPTLLAFLMRRLAHFKFARESRVLQLHEMADWDHKDARDVDYVIGACQLIRRKAFEQVGELDEKIFYGPEDIDFCLRMYRNGWQVYYYPQTCLVHYEQRMTKRRVFSKVSMLHFKGILHLCLKYGWKLARS
jgi:GT2 family glycosyltransferase